VWHLPPNERIVVQWNNEGQPIADGGALLALCVIYFFFNFIGKRVWP